MGAYYQWVPYYLLMLAVAFYFPHLLWKALEGGRLAALLLHQDEDEETQEEEEKDVREFGDQRQSVPWERIERIAEYLEQKARLGLGSGMDDIHLLFCEVVNLVVVVASLLLSNTFLGGQFWQFGAEALHWQLQEEEKRLDVDPLSRVFPKMTKCEFLMYGPSGTLQNVDALCVLGVNALNEKIFLALWFWLLFLLVVSSVQVLLRLAQLLFPICRIWTLRLSSWPNMSSIKAEANTLENLAVSITYSDDMRGMMMFSPNKHTSAAVTTSSTVSPESAGLRSMKSLLSKLVSSSMRRVRSLYCSSSASLSTTFLPAWCAA